MGVDLYVFRFLLSLKANSRVRACAWDDKDFISKGAAPPGRVPKSSLTQLIPIARCRAWFRATGTLSLSLSILEPALSKPWI